MPGRRISRSTLHPLGNCASNSGEAFFIPHVRDIAETSCVCPSGGVVGGREARGPERSCFQEFDLAPSRLATAKLLLLLDTDAQCPEVEVIDPRQYRHTWVSGTIRNASQPSGRHRVMQDRISSGSLLTGCNMFRKEETNLRISCALVPRLSIYTAHWS
jgi:hypothetical protein